MIARIMILLPFSFSVRHGNQLPTEEFDLPPYRVRLYPPIKSDISPADTDPTSPIPLVDLAERLRPSAIQEATGAILLDGAPTIQANLLLLDFLRDSFDRRRLEAGTREELLAHGDPPIILFFQVANSFLTRLRTITRGSRIRPVSSDETFWRLRYLNDDETELQHDPRLIRGRGGVQFKFNVTGIDTDVWTRAHQLPPNYMPPTWDKLILDAEAQLPEIGPAIVLAYTALEIFVASALDHLAALQPIPPALWEWINNRDDPYKEPTPAEGLDRLLHILAGRSLKQEQNLWEAFVHLRKARNSFAHEGRPVIDRTEVTPAHAVVLVSQARTIIDWVEAILPDALRRPKLDRERTFYFKRLIGVAVSPEAQP